MPATLRARGGRRRPQPLRESEASRRSRVDRGSGADTGRHESPARPAQPASSAPQSVASSGLEGLEVVAVDAHIPQAHPAGSTARTGTAQLDVRRAGEWSALLRGVDVVVPPGGDGGPASTRGRPPLYAAHNDLGTAVLLAAMHDAGSHRLVLAGSMVVYGEGRYACPEHGAGGPARAPPRRSTPGASSDRCPRCGRDLGWALVDEDAPLDPRSTYAATKLAQEHFAAAWARQTGGRGGRCATTTSTGRGCRATPRTPASPRSSGPRSSGARRRGCWRTAASGATSSTSPTWPRPTLAVRRSPARPVAHGRVQRLLGGAVLDRRRGAVGRRWDGGRDRPSRSCPAATAPATSGTWSRPARARTKELGFTAEIGPSEGLVRFATEPLRR